MVFLLSLVFFSLSSPFFSPFTSFYNSERRDNNFELAFPGWWNDAASLFEHLPFKDRVRLVIRFLAFAPCAEVCHLTFTMLHCILPINFRAISNAFPLPPSFFCFLSAQSPWA